MRARRALLVTVTAAVILVAAALPAGAVEPFGSVVTVTEPPPGCTIGIVNGDASNGSGAIRGFANFIGTGCAVDDVWYVASAGAAGKKELSPYRGQVLASSQNFTAVYVLYANSSGIFRASASSATAPTGPPSSSPRPPRAPSRPRGM